LVGIAKSFPTAESKHIKEPGPLGCFVPGLMAILVFSIEGTASWQYFVKSEDKPGTTEQPTNAGIPAFSTSEHSS
jgi:hypothetical protein